jgi:hypothetical protein
MICEVCENAPAKDHDIMCSDCAHHYTVLAQILKEQPSLVGEDFDRLHELFDWRSKKVLAIIHQDP